jgi:hypothetical protein
MLMTWLTLPTFASKDWPGGSDVSDVIHQQLRESGTDMFTVEHK